MRVGTGQGLDPEEEAILKGMAEHYLGLHTLSEARIKTSRRLKDVGERLLIGPACS